MRRLRDRPEPHYRGERCTSRLNSHPNHGYVREFSKVDVFQRGVLNEIVR